MLRYEALQGVLVGGLNHADGDFLSGAILGTDDCGFADGAPAKETLALGVGHIAPATAEVALVDLDRAVEHPAFLGERRP